MYFVMSRLDASNYVKLDFIVNFGVSPDIKAKMTEFLQVGGSKEKIYKYLESLNPIDLLKLHKYFFWADKKLHSVFFIEDKDQISEDLLIEFKDEDDIMGEQTYKQSKNLGIKKTNAKVDTGPKEI